MDDDINKVIERYGRMVKACWPVVIATEFLVGCIGAYHHSPTLMIVGFGMAWQLYFTRWMYQCLGRWARR